MKRYVALNRKAFKTCILFAAALLLSISILLTGCDKKTDAGVNNDIQILESGFSIENESMWAVVQNTSDKMYKRPYVAYTLLNADGKNVEENVGAYMIEIPYMEPGSTHYVAALLPYSGGQLADVRIEVEPGLALTKSSIENVIPVSQVKAANIQILYHDGGSLEFTFDIENDTDYDYKGYNVYCLYKDDKGSYCGGEDQCVLEGLNAHESGSFELYVDGFNGAEIEVYARPLTQEEAEYMEE